MTWFLTTRLGRWVAMIGGALLALAGAVAWGWTKGKQDEHRKQLEGYRDTRKAMDEVEHGSDPDLARRWLHERGKR